MADETQIIPEGTISVGNDFRMTEFERHEAYLTSQGKALRYAKDADEATNKETRDYYTRYADMWANVTIALRRDSTGV